MKLVRKRPLVFHMANFSFNLLAHMSWVVQITPLQQERKTRFNRPEILGRKYFDFARANLVKEGQRMC